MERIPRSHTYTAKHNSANNSAVVEGSKGRQRSRVTNGSALLPGVDGRSAWVRRCKDILEAHLSDLGGEDNTSAAERSLIRRAAVITTELEMMEARFAAAGHADPTELDLYQRTAGNLRRLLEAIGLQRRAKPLPDLDTFLEMRERAKRIASGSPGGAS
jgi:hypothetical protein